MYALGRSNLDTLYLMEQLPQPLHFIIGDLEFTLQTEHLWVQFNFPYAELVNWLLYFSYERRLV
jgi:hypothetical protein